MDVTSIKGFLEPEETLIWSGSPQRKIRVGPQHAPLLFVLVAFSAFLVLPIIGLLNAKDSARTSSSSEISSTTDQPAASQHKQSRSQRIGEAIFFLLFFGSIAGMFFYVIFNQIGGGLFSARTTVYALTDQRIIIVTGKTNKRATSLMLTTLSHVQMQQWPDGLGTISFGPRPVWPANSGLYMSIPSLENIIESGKVFQMISKARRTLYAPIRT